MLLGLFITSVVFICPSNSMIRKFGQDYLDKWVDEQNFLIVLFCNSDADKTCIKEKEKLKQLSEDMIKYEDIIFGYITKDSDSIIFSRYNVENIPMVKLFPYIERIHDYPMNIRIKDLEKLILETRMWALENRKTPEKPSNRKSKTSNVIEIDWLDMESTVKNPQKHAALILYESHCGTNCDLLEKVANIFKNERQISFYKMHFDKADLLRKTTPFQSNPTIFWYPMDDKERGFVYAGQIGFEVLVEFFNDRASLSRDYNGQLKLHAGRIPEVDKIIKENIINILLKLNMNYIIALVEKKGEELTHAKKYIDYYVSILKEIKNTDSPEQVLTRELKFIDEMLGKKSLNHVEMDDWQKFNNIISAFIEFAATRLSEDKAKHPAELKDDAYITKDFRSSRHEEL